MSKEAALRAMREAAYAERTARSGGAAPKATKPLKRPTAAKSAEPPELEAASEAGGLCGHRSMNGRSCTREQGHAAKSHRYG
jgi:hypothetical protein